MHCVCTHIHYDRNTLIRTRVETNVTTHKCRSRMAWFTPMGDVRGGRRKKKGENDEESAGENESVSVVVLILATKPVSHTQRETGVSATVVLVVG